MRNVRFAATLAAFALGIVACATTPKVETAPAPSGAVSSTSSSGNVVSWSGNISAVTESNSDVRQSSRGNGYGNAQLTRGDAANSTRINVQYSSGGSNSTDRYLNWAILPGRCGSGSLPVMPISNFPELTVGGDGRAQVSVELPFEFPKSGDYHINIYHERQQTLDQVVACGNLRPSQG
jgi:hypothetical protein